MTNTLSFSPRLITAPSARSNLKTRVILPTPDPQFPSPAPTRSFPLYIPTEDRASQGMMLGLVAAAAPAVAYALLQAWNLASGDALIQAVRAFVP